ncbi:hypothetical protein GCM10010149_06360 [Nonomuraea roseoviolacea subsp. roseoviolacea]|uniref:hypothetical protein n=1 Tax=Nonomuraea roseoviolacea TaxID=103837 RepID=UPI0031E49738
MTIKLLHRAPVASDTERDVPRWALRAAYAVPLLVLPSCLWRLPFVLDFPMGQIHDAHMPALWIRIPYILGLSTLSELAALLSIGLVRRWGEVVPGWVPFLGGRRVRPMAAIVPAAAGGVILSVLPVQTVLQWMGAVDEVPYENVWWKILANVCITPLNLWGPIVLALTCAYYVRRCRPGMTMRA